jgi:hypothetical protein
MNRAWNDALRLLGVSRDVILVVAGVFFFLPYFAFMALAPDPLAGIAGGRTADGQAMAARLGEFYSQLWWALLLIVILQAIGMLGLIALLTDRRRPTVGEALKTGARRMLSYIAAYLLPGLALGVLFVILVSLAALSGAAALSGLALLAVFAAWIYLFVRFSLVAPILVKEPIANPLAALRRSWALTRGNSARLFGFFFLLLVTYLVVMMVVSMVLGTLFGLFGQQVAQFGDALLMSLLNAAWVTLFLAVLSAVHDQFAAPPPRIPGQSFE